VTTVRRLLRVRDMRLYLLVQAFSLFGDNAMWLAAGVWVKTLTDSNSAAALTFFAFALPQVFAPAWGTLVNRFRRRPLLITANLATGAAMLPLLLVHDAGDVWTV
jgi:MFS family permease